MEIKDILSQRRKELNMTMKQVADKVGVSEGTISRWESGKIADMRRDKIMAYAQALNISPAIIMGWDNVDSSSTSKSIHAGKRIPVLGSVAAGIPIDATLRMFSIGRIYQKIWRRPASFSDYESKAIRCSLVLSKAIS